ncbi:hypothetical protein Cs7R123_18900 [Catellatospora sp. TT07R-123]|uniref:hypothetical protein n=1 Tax=Catellatospora sp. TT07R-123 TaxID=2733863 RepID=UPI001B04DA45|nr:hypothetical protein [Catellatospora sp. TT07R-123]GHJ44548.1 hypothetical protein Cs7R123_18900 [Catellatospora sp. TT07R-123]
MPRKSTLLAAGLLSAAAAGAGLLAYRKRRAAGYEQHLDQLAALDTGHRDSPRHKKERTPRKLKKQARSHGVPVDSHAGAHW